MRIKKIKRMRTLARRQLSGCWCECTCSLMLYAGIGAALGLAGIILIRFLYTFGYIDFDISDIPHNADGKFYVIAGIVTVLIMICLIPMKYAVCWYYAQAAEDRYVPAKCFFSCYNNPKHLKQTVTMGILVWFFKLIGLIPAAAAGYLCLRLFDRTEKAGYSTFKENLIFALLVLIMAAVFVLYMIYTMKLRIVPFVYAANPDKSALQVIKLSAECAKGNGVYLTEMMLSFIPWFIPCVMVFPLLYVLPYMIMTFTVAANRVIKDKSDERTMELPRNGGNKEDYVTT